MRRSLPAVWARASVLQSVLSMQRPGAATVTWQADGATFELPKGVASNTLATPFGSNGKLAEESVLPSIETLNETLPSAAELKRRLEKGEDVTGGQQQPDDEDHP